VAATHLIALTKSYKTRFADTDLALVVVIPVQTRMKPANAPFVLWLDSNLSVDDDNSDKSAKEWNQKRPKRHYGVVDRFTKGVYGYEEQKSSDRQSRRRRGSLRSRRSSKRRTSSRSLVAGSTVKPSDTKKEC
jgi:hypothetical protein